MHEQIWRICRQRFDNLLASDECWQWYNLMWFVGKIKEKVKVAIDLQFAFYFFYWRRNLLRTTVRSAVEFSTWNFVQRNITVWLNGLRTHTHAFKRAHKLDTLATATNYNDIISIK